MSFLPRILRFNSAAGNASGDVGLQPNWSVDGNPVRPLIARDASGDVGLQPYWTVDDKSVPALCASDEFASVTLLLASAVKSGSPVSSCAPACPQAASVLYY